MIDCEFCHLIDTKSSGDGQLNTAAVVQLLLQILSPLPYHSRSRLWEFLQCSTVIGNLDRVCIATVLSDNWSEPQEYVLVSLTRSITISSSLRNFETK